MSRRSGRDRGKSTKDGKAAFAVLSEGLRMGLSRLVTDNRGKVAQMLDAEPDANASTLAEACAGVMAQQSLNAEAFLARFFSVSILAHHCALLGKSEKGNESVLAARIAKAWMAKGVAVPQRVSTGSGGDMVAEMKTETCLSERGLSGMSAPKQAYRDDSGTDGEGVLVEKGDGAGRVESTSDQEDRKPARAYAGKRKRATDVDSAAPPTASPDKLVKSDVTPSCSSMPSVVTWRSV